MREPFGVAIGRRKCEQDCLPFLEVATVDLCLLDHLARRYDRRISSQEFLDCGRDELGLGSKSSSILCVSSEVPQTTANGAPGSVDTGKQQQPQCGADVIVNQWLPINLRFDQMADQILPWGGTTFADLFREKRPYFAVRLAQGLLIGDSNFEEIMNPFSEQIARLCGDTQHGSM